MILDHVLFGGFADFSHRCYGSGDSKVVPRVMGLIKRGVSLVYTLGPDILLVENKIQPLYYVYVVVKN